MAHMFVEYWQGIAAILFVSSIAAYCSSTFGVVTSILITIGSVMLTIALGSAGAVGFYKYLPFGIVIFPVFSWVGFFIGRFFRGKVTGNKV